MSKALVKKSLLALGLLTSCATFANQSEGLYITGGLGYGTIEGSDFDGGDLGRAAGKVGLGYQFNSVFALEGNAQYYFDATSSEGRYDFKSNAIVGNLLAVVRAPLAEKVYLVGKIGPGYANVHGELDAYRATFTEDSNGFAGSYGAGLEFAVSENLGILVEYLGTTVFVNDDEDSYSSNDQIQLNSVMGNLIWRF